MILRAEIVERAKAGDKCIFTGTFIVVPDVAALGLPGVNAEMMKDGGGGRGGAAGGTGQMGVSGLKALGVKDLTYKTAFLACMATSADVSVSVSFRSSMRPPADDSRPQSTATNIRSDNENGEETRADYLHSDRKSVV